MNLVYFKSNVAPTSLNLPGPLLAKKNETLLHFFFIAGEVIQFTILSKCGDLARGWVNGELQSYPSIVFGNLSLTSSCELTTIILKLSLKVENPLLTRLVILMSAVTEGRMR